MRHRRRALLALLTTGLLTSCSGGGGAALDGSSQAAGIAGFDHAQVGDEYWVAMPPLANKTGKPLTVIDARIVHVPAGLRVTGYRVDTADGGYLIGTSPVTATDDVRTGPIRVAAHDQSDRYYEARVKVTGAVHGDLTDCRFTYRQGSTTHHQDLGCDTRIRLGKPL
ncbi:hypothetical protein ACIRBZ_35195 [Streptomyces sp. NPDC094038]|uniref:hypothetical protein n=1 Tax=Streptomyces sp. NPDC094038 TaxID=3366055 RepID=UPI0037F5EF3C